MTYEFVAKYSKNHSESLLIVSELVVDMSLRRLVCSEELLEFLSCVHCSEGVNISFRKGDISLRMCSANIHRSCVRKRCT